MAATNIDTILNSHKVREYTQEALERVKATIIANMGGKARNASGRSVNSLLVKVDGTGGGLYGSKSFWAMEKGRKAGRVPAGFRQIIADWIVAKGITIYPPKGYRGKKSPLQAVSYLIAKKIREQGTGLHRRNEFQDIFSRVSKDETEALANKIRIYVASGIDYLHKDLAKNN